MRESNDYKENRRIQTAIHRYTANNENRNMMEPTIEKQGNYIMKPMTAKQKRKNPMMRVKSGKNFSKAHKSASKPTTAYTQSKLSVAI